jgi:hypothetical protein
VAAVITASGKHEGELEEFNFDGMARGHLTFAAQQKAGASPVGAGWARGLLSQVDMHLSTNGVSLSPVAP